MMITIQVSKALLGGKDGTEAPDPTKVGRAIEGSIGIENVISEKSPFTLDLKEESFQHQDKNGQVTIKSSCPTSELPRVSVTTSDMNKEDANVLFSQVVQIFFFKRCYLFQCYFNTTDKKGKKKTRKATSTFWPPSEEHQSNYC